MDVQAFAGGFTLGAVQAGLQLIGKREMVGGFGVRQCEANRRLLGDDWEAEACDPADWTPLKADIVISNPPCSGFSVLSHRDFRGASAKINDCMWHAVEFAAKCDPTIFIMESVQVAFRKGLPLMRQLRERLEERTGHRYGLYHVLQDNLSLGGCSKRPRYFMVCSQVPFGVEAPYLTALPTLGTAIEDLMVMDADEWGPHQYISPGNWWTNKLRSESGYVDGHYAPSSVGIERLLDLMDHGTGWLEGEAEASVARRHQEINGRLPESWETSTRLDGRTRADWAREKDFNLGMFQVNRWHWDRPARVVTGAGPTATIHPKLRRFLSHREVARIMGFPDDWKIEPLKDCRELGAGWGKGISVHCGEWIAQWARQSILTMPGELPYKRVSDFLDAGNELDEYVLDVSKHWKTVPITDHGPVPVLNQEQEGTAA